MKKFISIVVLVSIAMQLQAQEVMKVELKKGETVEYKVDDVKRVYFDKTTPVEGDVVVTPQNVTMYYDGTKQLSATNATNWYSDNEFVAKVDDTGLVSGKHVGTTKIIASNGTSSGTCDVTIKPKYNLFDTPILNWGASKSEILNAETHELISETETAIGYYYTFGSNKCVAAYSFKDGKLNLVAVAMNFSATMYINTGYYLIERFQPLAQQGYDYYFMDAMNVEDAKSIVYYTLDTSGSSSLIEVMYADATGFFSSSTRSEEQHTESFQSKEFESFFESLKQTFQE